MQKLYDRLLELLHKSPRSRVVRRFLREISEAPTVEKIFGTVRSYHFPRHGFRFDSDVRIDYIWWICLYLEHANGLEVSYQDYQPFLDELPLRIQRDDTRDAVRRKFGFAPIRSHQEPAPAKVPDVPDEDLKKWIQERAKDPMFTIQDTYRMEPFCLHFSFRISDGRLIRLSISKDRDEGSFERITEALAGAGSEASESPM